MALLLSAWALAASVTCKRNTREETKDDLARQSCITYASPVTEDTARTVLSVSERLLAVQVDLICR